MAAPAETKRLPTSPDRVNLNARWADIKDGLQGKTAKSQESIRQLEGQDFLNMWHGAVTAILEGRHIPRPPDCESGEPVEIDGYEGKFYVRPSGPLSLQRERPTLGFTRKIFDRGNVVRMDMVTVLDFSRIEEGIDYQNLHFQARITREGGTESFEAHIRDGELVGYERTEVGFAHGGTLTESWRK